MMKKICIVFSAILCGLALNACTISWTAYQYDAGTTDIHDYGYFLNGDGVKYTTYPSGISVVLCLMSGSSVQEVVNTGSLGSDGSISGAYTWTYSEKTYTVGNEFKVMLQDTTGGDAVYRELAAAANDAGTDPTTFSSVTLDSSYTSLGNMWSSELIFATGNYQDVPEPTSGLMLALGLVALGLKRKQKAA